MQCEHDQVKLCNYLGRFTQCSRPVLEHVRKQNKKLKERIAELERLLTVLLEAHHDGHELSGDEIDDVYRALEDQKSE